MSDQELIEKAKMVLSAMDPNLAVIAIQQIEVKSEEVDKIKDFLSGQNPKAVQCAIAEMQQEVMAKEISGVRDKLAAYDAHVLKAAAAELGLTGMAGYCMNGIDCRGSCILVMTIRCTHEMYVATPMEQVINPVQLGGVSRAVAAALIQAKQMGEF